MPELVEVELPGIVEAAKVADQLPQVDQIDCVRHPTQRDPDRAAQKPVDPATVP